MSKKENRSGSGPADRPAAGTLRASFPEVQARSGVLAHRHRPTRLAVATRVALLLAVLMNLAGCAQLSVTDETIRAVQSGAVNPCHVVFTCHGILCDLGTPWDHRLAAELRDAGQLGLVTEYWSDPTGLWFGWGKRAPARLIAETADRIQQLHDECGCECPLRISAVGFSAGCLAITDAARRMRHARFDRVVMIKSASSILSGDLTQLVRRGKIGRVLNYWSPIDLVTLFAPLGAGSFGRWSDDRIENSMRLTPHMASCITEGLRSDVITFLAEGGEAGSPRPEFRQRLAELLLRARSAP